MAAAFPKSLAERGRRSSSATRTAALSHGRGGAGNMKVDSLQQLQESDLQTPTLKTDVYTTGRGGSGNMAKNDDPETARRAQDVVGVARRESASSTHVGRGGAANIFRPTPEEISNAKKDNPTWESAIFGDEADSVSAAGKNRPSGDRGLAERGREWLGGLLAKKDSRNQ